MHVDKPQSTRLGRQCNHQAPPHFFLDFSQDKHPRSLSIPTGKHKFEFSPLTLLSFLLRKELGSSLKSTLSNPRVHTSKERQSPTPKFMLYVALCKSMHAPLFPISKHLLKWSWLFYRYEINVRMLVSLWFSTSGCLMNVSCIWGTSLRWDYDFLDFKR